MALGWVELKQETWGSSCCHGGLGLCAHCYCFSCLCLGKAVTCLHWTLLPCCSPCWSSLSYSLSCLASHSEAMPNWLRTQRGDEAFPLETLVHHLTQEIKSGNIYFLSSVQVVMSFHSINKISWHMVDFSKFGFFSHIHNHLVSWYDIDWVESVGWLFRILKVQKALHWSLMARKVKLLINIAK